VQIPDLNPNPGLVVLALAAWNSSAPSFTAAFNAGDACGVIAFRNQTSDYTLVPPSAPPFLDGWTTDLIMTVPEPSPLTLGVLGSAALAMSRRYRTWVLNPRH